MLFTWCQSLLRRTLSQSRQRSGRRACPRRRLDVEPLEDRELLATLTGLTQGNSRLFSFDSNNPNAANPAAAIAITGLQSNETILAIDYRPKTGELYGVGSTNGLSSTSRLYKINFNPGVSAQATQVGPAFPEPLWDGEIGFDFDPVNDSARVVSEGGQNLRINPDTGGVTKDGILTVALGGIAYSNNVSGASSTELFGINHNSFFFGADSVVRVTNPNAGSVSLVGQLGDVGTPFDANTRVGFDIASDGTAYAALTSINPAISRLWIISLTDPFNSSLQLGTIGPIDPNNLQNATIIADLAAPLPMPGVAITQSGGSTSVMEGGATDTYTVVLQSRPTTNVTITLTPNQQLGVAPVQLSFTPANWNTAQTVTVTAADDSVVEGNHTGTITHGISSTDLGYKALAPISLVVNVIDNDVPTTPPGVTLTQTGGSTDVTEGGATDTYTVALQSQPTANVTITLTPSQQVSAAPATLTFTPANWNTAQTVTVTAADDSTVEGNHTGTITHGISSTDPNYNALAPVSLVVNVSDNDNHGPLTLTGPSSPTTNHTPTITWSVSAGAVRYDLWVDSLSTGQPQIIRQQSLTTTSFTPVTLLQAGSCRAWVRAFSAAGNASAWSAARDFTILAAPPAAPTLTSPSGSTTNHAPTITWSASTGASRYDLWVNNLTTGQSQVIRQQTLTATSFTPAMLLPAGTYRAWVRALNAAGEASAWSTARDFTILATPPAATTLTGPSSSTSNHTPTLTWSAITGAARYDLWVNNLTTGQSQVIRQQTLTATSFTPASNLSAGTYRAWVRVFNAAGEASAWSVARDFTITP